MTDNPPRSNDSSRAIALWLFACCAMIFAMVVIGGITRLTESGLSMVEWRPLIGWIPPLTEMAWQDVFTKYQATPEYQKINAGMTLDEFKTIFWWEFIHRVWGRLIGAVFLLPFLWFLIRGRVPRRLVPKLLIMFILGGLQGLLGWYMVKSGLVDRPSVSQYRLTAHLGAAIVIYAYMLWTALGLLNGRDDGQRHPLAGSAAALAGLVFVTILSGGFVAGLDAGLAYNTFPLMDGRVVPEIYFQMQPAWINLFENIAAVQFNHRLLAIATAMAIGLFWWRATHAALPTKTRQIVHIFFATALIQVALGISTLLLYVPTALGAAHQAGALVVFTMALWAAFDFRHAAHDRQSEPQLGHIRRVA